MSSSLALSSLTPQQLEFIHSLQKAELHAHLNGSIPIHVLQHLALTTATVSAPDIAAVIQTLLAGPALATIADFFNLFPAIYALTATPAALRTATRAVLALFLTGPAPQCTYLELRTTPRATPSMDRAAYLDAVLAEVEAGAYAGRVGLIVSLDRRMERTVMQEVVQLAVRLRHAGRAVVGIDLCGDPMAGDVEEFGEFLAEAREGGLGVTLHIAETAQNTPEETLRLLEYGPTRLGHATFLNDRAKAIVRERKIPIEICLTSNILCKTVATLDAHHIRYYLEHDHPIAICTDDPLPFRTSLPAEYALLLAAPPLGLGLSEDEVRRVAEMSLGARFL